MPGESDEELLRACLAGGPGAWDAFVDRFAPYLAGVCRATLAASGRPSGPQEVDDMLQEAFLALLDRDLRALRAFRHPGRPRAYLAAVAASRVLKDRSLRPRAIVAARETDPTPGPQEVMEAAEAGEALRRGLETLPPRTRLALALQADGASLREIAGTLRISEDAAAQALSRGRERLRGRLGPPES